MIRNQHKPEHLQLRIELGFQDGQMRVPYMFKNLWMSFDNGATAFCYGDMNMNDFMRVHKWIIGHDHMSVFTGWNEHHGTDWQQMEEASVRIDKDGITFPYREAVAVRIAERRK